MSSHAQLDDAAHLVNLGDHSKGMEMRQCSLLQSSSSKVAFFSKHTGHFYLPAGGYMSGTILAAIISLILQVRFCEALFQHYFKEVFFYL